MTYNVEELKIENIKREKHPNYKIKIMESEVRINNYLRPNRNNKITTYIISKIKSSERRPIKESSINASSEEENIRVQKYLKKRNLFIILGSLIFLALISVLVVVHYIYTAAKGNKKDQKKIEDPEINSENVVVKYNSSETTRDNGSVIPPGNKAYGKKNNLVAYIIHPLYETNIYQEVKKVKTTVNYENKQSSITQRILTDFVFNTYHSSKNEENTTIYYSVLLVLNMTKVLEDGRTIHLGGLDVFDRNNTKNSSSFSGGFLKNDSSENDEDNEEENKKYIKALKELIKYSKENYNNSIIKPKFISENEKI